MFLVLAACGGTTSTSTETTTPSPSITFSPIVTVTTVAHDEFEPWALVVVGDYGDGGDAEYAVAAAMEEWVDLHPETVAMVTTGDNFYVADVESAWTEPYGWVDEAGLPVWATPGNHDIETPGQWAGSVTAFGSFPRWRTRSVGGVTLVLLDSNQVNSPEQQAWLETTAANLEGRPWFAVFHFPWLSCGSRAGSEDVVGHWGEILSGATLVLNGHDHNYQRYRSERGWAIVTGGGGHRLYELAPCEENYESVAAVVSFHFLTIVGAPGSVTVEARGTDGVVFDSVVVPIGP